MSCTSAIRGYNFFGNRIRLILQGRVTGPQLCSTCLETAEKPRPAENRRKRRTGIPTGGKVRDPLRAAEPVSAQYIQERKGCSRIPVPTVKSG